MLAREAGIVALALILFEGGLSSGFSEIRPVLKTSILLATLGTLPLAMLSWHFVEEPALTLKMRLRARHFPWFGVQTRA